MAEKQTPIPRQQESFIKSFISGGFGGMCLVATGQPFDYVKVLLQTGSNYKGSLDVVRQTYAKDGIRGFYRGMSAPLIGVTPIYAICFWGYNLGKRIASWAVPQETPDGLLPMSHIFFAGGFSAIPTTLLMAPGERIKVLLQTQGSGSAKKYNGPVDVVTKLYREGGLRSVYKGTVATLLRDVPGSIAYFGAYEGFKRLLTPAGASPDSLNPLSIFFAGGMAGVCNWLVAIPPDVIKSRYQAAPEGTYRGLVHVTTILLKEEGVKGLFKGVGPAMLRAFPANASCFLGVEVCKKILNIF